MYSERSKYLETCADASTNCISDILVNVMAVGSGTGCEGLLRVSDGSETSSPSPFQNRQYR